jgi:hypothetical protein
MRLPCYLRFSVAPLVVAWCSANALAQTPTQGYVLHPHQEVQVASLPSIVADSKADTDVLAASLATAVADPEVCCGRRSALEDQVAAVSHSSLKELGQKIRGKHVLDSGASVIITDEYWPAASVNAEQIVGTLEAQHPLLMLWGSHVYVLYGAVFNQYLYDDGASMHVIEKLLLLDTRYDDDRRYVTFDRQNDDWDKVAGLLSLTITR